MTETLPPVTTPPFRSERRRSRQVLKAVLALVMAIVLICSGILAWLIYAVPLDLPLIVPSQHQRLLSKPPMAL